MAGFAKYPIVAVLRAEDLERAKRFYTDVMGYAVDEKNSSEGALVLTAAQGTSLMVYERPGMPAPQNTVLGIPLPDADFDGCVDYLRGKGVTLEDYDIPELDLKTVGGVATMDGGRGAWIKDTEGNIISISTM